MLKLYRSWHTGAPTLQGGVQRSFINLLQSILVDGYALCPNLELTSEDGIATGFCSLGHPYEPYDIIEISGADQSEYNGEFRVLTVTLYSFTFKIDVAAAAVATGDIVAKIAPAGWTKVDDDGADLAIFQYPGGNQRYLYIDESTCSGLDYANREYQTAKFYAVEDVNNVNDYTNRTSSTYWRKSVNGLYESNWLILVSDTFLLFAVTVNTDFTGFDFHYFGEFESFRPNDPYNLLISGHYDYYIEWNNYHHYYYAMFLYNSSFDIHGADSNSSQNSGQFMIRNYMGDQINHEFWLTIGLHSNNYYGTFRLGDGQSIIGPYNRIDGYIRYNQLFIKESGTIRGRFPNIYNPQYNIVDEFDPTWTLIKKDMLLNGNLTDILFIQFHRSRDGVYGSPTYQGLVAIDLLGDD